MKLAALSKISSKVGVTALKVQKNSPTLLFVGGVAGIVTTVVLASRATLKLDEVLEETNSKLADIDTVLDLGRDTYGREEARHDKAVIYINAGVHIAKLYGPSVLLGGASIGLLVGSHQILNRRNAALTAAYAGLDKAFRQYRNRVVNDLGENKDREYRYGVEDQKVTVTDKDGKRTQVVKKVASSLSEYAVLFRQDNPNWQSVPEYNYLFIRGIQNHANDRLNAKGFLLLNDVLDDLGFERTTAGCVVGWLKNGDGDGYVDFGIFDDKDALRIHDYITGREGELLLDFNVDGVVYDKI